MPLAWPQDVRAALDTWRQGDLILRPGVSWLGPAAADELTGTEAGEYEFEPVADPSTFTVYGVIASQTCDIAAEGPGARHPFVEIHPVVNMSGVDANQRRMIEQFKVRYLVALTDPPEPGFWVVDLRLVSSVSKALLVNRAPLTGFASEDDRLNFAEALSRKKRRAAVHDALSYSLPRLLADHIKGKDSERLPPDWYLSVEQIRLDITGDRLGPDRVSLLIISDTDLPVEHRTVWRSARRRIDRLFAQSGFALGSISFSTPDRMSARHYRTSVPLDLPELRRPSFW